MGIRQHLDALASYGLLATFIEMTTDSRSLLSMSRHEYFRRVLCDWLGDQVQAGAHHESGNPGFATKAWAVLFFSPVLFFSLFSSGAQRTCLDSAVAYHLTVGFVFVVSVRSWVPSDLSDPSIRLIGDDRWDR